MRRTNEEKKTFCLKADLMAKQLKTDTDLSPQDRTDAVMALETASLFVRGGIIRHGVKKEFCRDSAKLFRYLAAAERFTKDNRDFFREVSDELGDIFPDENKRSKGNRK